MICLSYRVFNLQSALCNLSLPRRVVTWSLRKGWGALTSHNFLAEQVTSLLDPDHFRFLNVFNPQKERGEG